MLLSRFAFRIMTLESENIFVGIVRGLLAPRTSNKQKGRTGYSLRKASHSSSRTSDVVSPSTTARYGVNSSCISGFITVGAIVGFPGVTVGVTTISQRSTVSLKRLSYFISKSPFSQDVNKGVPPLSSTTTKAAYLEAKDLAVAAASNQELTAAVKLPSRSCLTSIISVRRRTVSRNRTYASFVSPVSLKIFKKRGNTDVVIRRRPASSVKDSVK